MCYATGTIPCMDACAEAGRCLLSSEEEVIWEKTMNFSDALTHLKNGQCIARTGWNGEGMFLYLVSGSTFAVNRPPLLGIMAEGQEVSYRPHVDMKTADGTCVPWIASQSDLLEEDWVIVYP